MPRKRRIDLVTDPAFDSLLAEAQWRVLKRGMAVSSRTQLIELGVAVLVALERHMENCGYVPFLPQDVIRSIERNWAYIRGSELGYQAAPAEGFKAVHDCVESSEAAMGGGRVG